MTQTTTPIAGCVCVPGGCLCLGGSIQTIVAGGRARMFEMHPYLGPCVVHKKTLAECAPPKQTDPFWDAVMTWDIQGRRVADGVCVWEPIPPKPVRVLYIGGRSWREIGDAEPPVQGEKIYMQPPDLLAMLREVRKCR